MNLNYKFHCAIQSIVSAANKFGFSDRMIEDQIIDVMEQARSGNTDAVVSLSDGTRIEIKERRTFWGGYKGFTVKIDRSLTSRNNIPFENSPKFE